MNSFVSRHIIIGIPLMSPSIHFNFVEKSHVVLPPAKTFAKVMFSQVFVSPRGVGLCIGEGLCLVDLCPGCPCVGGFCPGRSLSRGSLSREVSIQGGLCPEVGLCLG